MIFDRALSGAEVQALVDAAGDSVLSVTATVYDEAGNDNVFLYRGRLARTPYLRYLAII